MPVKIIESPKTEPVSLDELKRHLRIVHDDEDDTLLTYLKSATRYAESTLTWRSFVEQELELTLDGFQDEIRLPRPPLQEVVSVKYFDKGNTEQTVDTDVYIVDTDSEPGRVIRANGKQWPTDLRQINAVKIRYKAGYETFTGTVNVTNGEDDPFVNVSWVSGDKFDTGWKISQRIIVNGIAHKLSTITDDENLTIQESAGEELTNVNYSVNFVPQEIKQGVLILAGHFFEVREPVIIGTSVMTVPFTVEALLMPWRSWIAGGEAK